MTQFIIVWTLITGLGTPEQAAYAHPFTGSFYTEAECAVIVDMQVAAINARYPLGFGGSALAIDCQHGGIEI